MTEVATLIGTHHLIAGGTQGSASAPTIQPLENAPIDWALPPIGWVIFCHGVAAATGASQQRKQCDNGVFMVTSVELSSSRRHSARADA